MDPRLSWLTTFVAVAEERHFGRAARRVNLSRSAVSRHVRQLEQTVGVPLFRRTTREVTLTDEGRRLHHELADAVDLVERSLRRTAAGHAIRLAYTGAAELRLIPHLARRWNEMGHGHLQLLAAGSAAQLEGIAAGTIDAGVQWEGPVGPAFSVTPIHTEVAHIAVPADHPLAGHDDVPLLAFADEEWLMATDASDSSARRFLITTCRRHGFEPRILDAAIGHSAQMSLVAAGYGLAIVPSVALSNPGLAPVAIVRVRDVTLSFVAVTQRQPRPLVHRLVEVLADCGHLLSSPPPAPAS
ncbi:MAG: LysR substrate-binding domain-containing protein [Actinomycetota bacterium]|nr:LysR substrate-binding domain-containing protein [Actinomycetota bacterium]